MYAGPSGGSVPRRPEGKLTIWVRGKGRYRWCGYLAGMGALDRCYEPINVQPADRPVGPCLGFGFAPGGWAPGERDDGTTSAN